MSSESNKINYLNSIHLASITHIKWVNDEQEDKSFKNSFAGISKNEGNKHKLRADKQQKLGGGDLKNDKPNDHYNSSNYYIHYAMKLFHCRLCII